MSKRPSLNAATLKSAAGTPADPVDRVEANRRTAQQRSRVGKVQVQGFFDPEVRQRLKILSARSGRTVEDLLGEAIDDLLSKYAN